MVNRFLRTAPTRTLLATIAGVVLVIGGGAAIAVAASSGGPVPAAPSSLASAVHGALTAPQVQGFSADISFTNNLIGASELQGTDPLLQGGPGHIWVSNNALRIELYNNGGGADPEIVVNNGSWWISDPILQTVYQGTLPSQPADKTKGQTHTPPSLSQIQGVINQLAKHLNISGAQPTDTGGQPTYTVTLTPKQPGGLFGQLQVAWDATHGVPLQFAVYARGNSTPVLGLSASNVSYQTVPSSMFTQLNKPTNYRTVNVATPAGASATTKTTTRGKKHAKDVTGVQAVAKQLNFKLAAPSSVAGLRRQSVSLTGEKGHHGALVVYGQGLGAIAVMEEPASSTGSGQIQLSTSNGDHQRGVILPTFSVHGASAQELGTALGTFVRFTSRGVTYTLIGSVNSHTARAAARGL